MNNHDLYAVDLQGAAELIEFQLKTLWNNPGAARAIAPTLLWGPPGVGKSAVVRNLCERLNIGFVDVRLAQREPVDIRGLPVPKGDRVEWLISSEWPREVDSKGIIMFDELTSADRTLQVAAYEFILDRRLGDLYKVPDGWYVMAAGNRLGDGAVAVTLSSALANRFCHLEVKATLEPWIEWARTQDMPPEVTGFLRFSPQSLFSMKGDTERGWPSPRSWERVGFLYKNADGLSPNIRRAAIVGLIGEGAAIAFEAYLSWANKLPDIPAYLAGKVKMTPPEEVELKYALCAGIAHYIWEVPAQDIAIRQLLKIANVLPSDFSAMLMSDVLSSANPEQIAKVFSHPIFPEWRDNNGDAMATWTARKSKKMANLIQREASTGRPQ